MKMLIHDRTYGSYLPLRKKYAAFLAVAALAIGCQMTNSISSGNSPHYDGDRFYNVPMRKHAGVSDALKWRLTRDPGPWDEPTDVVEYGQAPPAKVETGEARVTFVTHATVLIQIDGVNIITDPVYAESVGPYSWASRQRVRPPGIKFSDLPSIDVVLVSHNHYDHMCLETLTRLEKRDSPLVITGKGNAAVLSEAGISRIEELDWWQSAKISDRVKATFSPAQHSSNRGIFDRYKSLWGGFLVEGTKHRVFFAGDTGEGPHFAQIRERLGEPSIALLPIGAFRPSWMMKAVHLSPAEAVVAHKQLGAHQSMAMHFGTFPLADDGQHEATQLLLEELPKSGLTSGDFWVPQFGEGREVPVVDM